MFSFIFISSSENKRSYIKSIRIFFEIFLNSGISDIFLIELQSLVISLSDKDIFLSSIILFAK